MGECHFEITEYPVRGAIYAQIQRELTPALEAIQQAFRRAVEHTGPTLLPVLKTFKRTTRTN